MAKLVEIIASEENYLISNVYAKGIYVGKIEDGYFRSILFRLPEKVDKENAKHLCMDGAKMEGYYFAKVGSKFALTMAAVYIADSIELHEKHVAKYAMREWFFSNPSLIRNEGTPFGNGIFLNISNHPMETWGEEQKDAIDEKWAIDMPFPNIPSDKERIFGIVLEFKDKIIALANALEADHVTCHVMGDMVFTFKLVTELKKYSYIDCVESTTSRDVVYNEDGTKTSKFTFGIFRQY